ncbi:beta-1,6-glucan boisynthesis protein (Knh1), putative [Talaromyces stipitatus ATCC 10500]|uniref:Beta-1,6-glucan boisynthesis protein (Knh1), putative n=1 Tax=Talaromyces stipitatus (strain ATCC 10500 / CBS 375.48 / QM 6759 / NRRL 1006) TaxID=441959 RepID=B8M101_TALSN|nr:beta-1,6-glucan boisynthesis protein (Knh1), putative [Talaromyces stipitatus ATCC 10500]EED21781.1 beta-1,6-glucan boisynthesis protein (Knh1), putative [Talaromyces stipitatus ATCC 10500]
MKLTKATSLLALITLPLLAFADVEFIEPRAGSTVKSGDILTAYWKDSGDLPSLLELHEYDLFLCAGGPEIEYSEELALLVPNGLFDKGNSVSFQIRSDLGSEYPDAYFLKMTSRGTNNMTLVNYSERFSVTGMTGTFSELVQYGLLLAANDTAKYHQELKLRKRQVATAIIPAKDVYNVPYPQQTRGLTKYAPMGKRPATTITAKSGPPQFPTSAFEVAHTFLPIPTWQTTLTASRTWTTSGMENPATPAPHPKDDMQIYLRRWADDE